MTVVCGCVWPMWVWELYDKQDAHLEEFQATVIEEVLLSKFHNFFFFFYQGVQTEIPWSELFWKGRVVQVFI